MKIKVYFENKTYSEKVAEFIDDETYMACLPSLVKLAKKINMIVTESVEEYKWKQLYN